MNLHPRLATPPRMNRRRRLSFEVIESRLLLTANPVEFPIRSTGGPSIGVAVGSDGNVWATLGTNEIAKINPTTNAILQQYPIPTPNSAPGPITSGPNGTLWFIETATNQFGVINEATGVVTEIPFLPSTTEQIEDLVEGPDGNIWFTEYNANKIGEINPTTHVVTEFPIPTTNSEPYGITAGSDGNLWFAESGANQIAKFSLTTHLITEYSIQSTTNVQPEGITSGPDGNIWFTETSANKIGTINVATDAINSYGSGITAGAGLSGITSDRVGDLWFTETNTSNVGRLAPAANDAINEFYDSTYNSRPLAITCAPDGNLWVGLSNGPIAKVTTGGSATAVQIPSDIAADPVGLVAGPDGNLWFTQPAANQIGVFNIDTHFTTEYTDPLGNFGPNAIIVGPDNNLWFTENGANIGEFNLTTDTFSNYAMPAGYSSAAGIVAGSDGFIYFTQPSANMIGRINPIDGAFNAFSTGITAGSNLAGITLGQGGVLWFTEYSARNIGELDPSTMQITEYPVGSNFYGYPDQIVVGSDKALWFTSGYDAPDIGRIDPTTHNVSHVVIPNFDESGVYSNSNAIAAGPDGNIWFTEGAEDGNISLFGAISTANGALVYQNNAGESLNGIAAGPTGDGNIWYTGFTGFENPGIIGAVPLSTAATATQLAITTPPPAGITAGKGFGLVVSAQNSSGAIDTFATGTVTISLNNPSGGTATLGGTLTEPIVDGLATFPGLSINQAGNGYTIQATATGLSPATSPAFNVANQATHLVVLTQPPTGLQAQTPFGFAVAAEDNDGNIDGSYTGIVTVSIGNNPSGGVLGGTVQAAPFSGVITFSNLTLSNPGSGYTLQVSSPGLTSASTAPFVVTQPPASQLVVAMEPTSVVSGAGFSIVVDADGDLGALDPTYNGIITLSLASEPVGGVLGGPLSTMAVAGVATFTGLTLSKVGAGYSIQASAPGLNPGSGSPITVTPAPATQLVVTASPPSTVTAGVGFGLTISAEDAAGDIDPTFNGLITLSLASNPGGTALGGGLTAMAVAGVATFTGLTLGSYGAGYTIQANASGLTSATTAMITVKPAAILPSNVSGTVFLDPKASGTLAPGDAGIAGRTVFVDLNHDGTFDPGDLYGLTTSTGSYSITLTTPGQYTIRLVTFPGEESTGGGFSTAITTTSGQNVSGLNFGLQEASTVAPVPVVAAPFGPYPDTNVNTAIVQGLYHYILGRPADPSGLSAWVADLNSHALTVTQVAAAFYASPEYDTRVVNSYYLTYLGRAADPNGLAYWVSEMQAGLTETQVVLAFISAENTITNPGPGVYVQTLFAEILGRAPTTSEVSSWVNAMISGTSRSSVAASILGSTESLTRIVTDDYVAFLGRVPQSSEATSWVNAIHAGLSLDQAAESILGSPEFSARASTSVS